VVALEQQQLRDTGHPDLAGRVRWVARDDGDGLGYDVLSFTGDGRERHIEVKTTALGAQTRSTSPQRNWSSRAATRSPSRYTVSTTCQTGPASSSWKATSPPRSHSLLSLTAEPKDGYRWREDVTRIDLGFISSYALEALVVWVEVGQGMAAHGRPAPSGI
jgi:Domain of unknown function (DUF3883)